MQFLEGLVEAGLTTERQLRAGLARARRHDSPFLPSVGQFISWCEQAVVDTQGLPTETQAYLDWARIAQKPRKERDWTQTHPAVCWAAERLAAEHFNLMQEKYEHRRRQRFNLVWRQAVDAAVNGYDFHAALPAPEPQEPEGTPMDPEIGAQRLQALLAQFE